MWKLKNVFPFADILKKTIFEYATSRTTYCYRESEAFTVESQAIEKAEEMRVKKIASLKKQIEKLEKLNFKKEE